MSRSRRPRASTWLARTGVRRGARVGAALSVFLLLLSGLSINALTAGIDIASTAIGPPEHRFADDGEDLDPDEESRRGPIPRAAFERFTAIPARGPAAFGGDRIYDIDVDGTSYRVHEFTTVGSAATFTITRAINVEVLIVAGGGGGGGSIGGGGGAGEFIERVGAANRVSLTPSGSPFTVTVGAGGTGGSYTGPTDGDDGDDSSAFGITANGGGGGGAISKPGSAGGSGGGGGSATSNVGGAAVRSGMVEGVLVGFGNAGGIGSCSSCGSADAVAGGGGGAGGVGSPYSGQQGGDGGPGRSSSITGVAREFAGGGGGGINTDSRAGANALSSGPSGAGQSGGGAGGDHGTRATDRGVTDGYGQDAVPNSGSGGGGAGNPIGETGRAGGTGGSGIVIVRYEIPRATWTPITATGGTVTEYVGDGTNGTAGFRYRVHTFPSDGTFTVTDAGSDGEVDALLVGGGGGGGSRHGGGGGAGAVREVFGTEVTAQAYTVDVGDGGVGAARATNRAAANGAATTAIGLVAAGGGRGASNNLAANVGGSGGGAASASEGAAGTSGVGNAGGRGVSGTNPGIGDWAGGGGGGAGGAGGAATGGGSQLTAAGGDGGAGALSSMTGAAVRYGGGGGGSHEVAAIVAPNVAGSAGRGGQGGGGAGGSLVWHLYTHTTSSHPNDAVGLDALFASASFVGSGLGRLNSGASNVTRSPDIIDWRSESELNAITGESSSDQFALLVAGTFVPLETGTYTFTIEGDDAVDLFIGGTNVANHYGGHGIGALGTNTGTIPLVAGETYPFRARMEEMSGGAGLQVAWKKPSQSAGSVWYRDPAELDPDGRDGSDGTGGGGGAGGSTGSSIEGPADAEGGRGGDGVVVIRYPLFREISAIPSEVREVIAGEGETTAVLRWRVPDLSPPSVDLDGYRIEYAATNGNSWTALTTGVTFSTSGTGSETLVTAALTGVPDASRHRFRITPRRTVDGPSTIVEPVAKGGDTVTLVGDDVVHQFTTVGTGDFDLSTARSVEYLVVGGGGGGGTGWDGAPGGGGGAGGVLQGADDLTMDVSVTISVGAGGAGGSGGGGFDNPNVVGMATKGRDGTASSFGGLAAPGGGGGGEARALGNAGGSGGGAGGRHNVASSRVGGGRVLAGTGNPGGGSRSTSSTGAGGGGGGGAGGAGASADGTTAGGAGGSGISSSISGATVAYAVGGVGGAFGIASDIPGVAATVRGSGGGGGAKNGSGGVAGGSGATGTVILRYAYSTPPARGGDAVYDILDDGVAYRVHEFRTPGAHTLEVLRDIDIEYLVVGGGASGTRGQCSVYWGHGGGGGGVSTGSAPVTAGSIPVTVGPGGAGSTTAACGTQHSGNDGGASTLGLRDSTVTSTGGKGAVSNQVTGGASGTGTIDGVASIAQGGGGSGGQLRGAGGGGGAGGAANGVNGGPGVDIAITGIPTTYGAGGPGRSEAGFGTPSPRVLGIGGGGYDGFGSRDWTFAPGGDGAVIVRYRIPSDGLDPLVATGGSVTTFVGDGTTGDDGDVYRVHTFLSNGTFTVTQGSGDVEYLVVGGGGGGGNTMGGGGGAGGLLTGTVTASTRTVVVGPGGAGSTARGSKGGNGTDSGFGDIQATGGGGGGSWTSPPGATGGSGGGGSGNSGTGAGASGSGQGSAGGASGGSTGLYQRAGGGGGAGGAGASGASGSAGGAGLELSFSGVPEIYAAGGGGGTNGGTAGAGGSDGVGGRGSTDCPFNGTVPLMNSGSGGGGGGYLSCGDGTGGSGAAGIVIVRYPVGRPAQFPSAVRDAVAGEGATTAVIRFTVPEKDAPGPANAAPTSAHYRIERQAIGSSVWYPVGPSQTFSVTGSGASRVVTVALGDVPSDSRHAFRITPIGVIDGPATTVTPLAKGGDTVTLVGDDVVHQYTTVGSADLELSEARTVEYLVVGGGGSGGMHTHTNRGSGGGGAGGMVAGTADGVNGVVTVAVGAGGKAPTAETAQGTDGGSSGLTGGGLSVNAVGGGGGGGAGTSGTDLPDLARSGRSGGSGGGAANFNGAGGTGTVGQGRNGGAQSGDHELGGAGGGGGGAGAAGGAASGTGASGNGGAGGAGSPSSITGGFVHYAAGGGGGHGGSGAGGTGGQGGGGVGERGSSSNPVPAASGSPGTGGGGGGARRLTPGSGGSGTVILRYPLAP